MIDWNKPIETCFGSEAELVATLSEDGRKVVKYHDNGTGGQRVILVADNGTTVCGASEFIRNRPEPKRFRCVYRDKSSGRLSLGLSTWPSDFEARKGASTSARDYELLAVFEETV